MKRHLTFNQIAQGLHICLGALFLAIPVAKHWHHPRILGTVVGLIYAGIKEGWYDVRYEDKATRGNGFVDFAFYLVGMGAAWIVLL